MNKKCIIIGAGTYGNVYAEYLKKEYHILGFADDDEELIGKEFSGLKVLGNVEEVIKNAAKDIAFFVPIGDCSVRVRILKKLNRLGFRTPNYIHPTANIHDSVKIADNAVYILQGTVIMPFSRIDKYVMISSGTIITHHAHIQRGVFISFGVNIGASLTVKERAFIGIGATIMTGIKSVGENSLTGAGAVIIEDIPDNAVVVGNPGRILKYRN
jgi:sugar O-acyltransferase (sialic acid O-acetyltransferase NeuD family)